jgi:hypothetical protein
MTCLDPDPELQFGSADLFESGSKAKNCRHLSTVVFIEYYAQHEV